MIEITATEAAKLSNSVLNREESARVSEVFQKIKNTASSSSEIREVIYGPKYLSGKVLEKLESLMFKTNFDSAGNVHIKW